MSKSNSELEFHDLDTPASTAETSKIVTKMFINETDQESICGIDNRSKITSTLSLPYQAICKLYMTNAADEVYVGTGWLTHADRLYTAGHNLYDPDGDGWMKSITVIPGLSGLSEPFGRYEAVSIMTTEGWITQKDKRYDMGAIRIGSRVTVPEYLKPRVDDTNRASVCGYSADRDTGLFQYVGEDLIRKDGGRFHYRIDTFGGASGAPVLVDGIHSIGIHNYGGCDNTASDLYPEFIAGVESWSNAGLS